MTNANSGRSFPLAPLQGKSWQTLLAITIVELAIVLAASLHALPTPARWLLPAFIVVVMTAVGLALGRRRISLEGRTLVVAATFYTLRMNLDALDLPNARIVDLAEHGEFAPMIKLGGYGVPGFRAGNYLLRNRARAFCLLTARDRVLILPRRDGKFLVLSPEKPQALLSALNELAATNARR